MEGIYGGIFLNNQIWSRGRNVSYSKSNKGFRRIKIILEKQSVSNKFLGLKCVSAFHDERVLSITDSKVSYMPIKSGFRGLILDIFFFRR